MFTSLIAGIALAQIQLMGQSHAMKSPLGRVHANGKYFEVNGKNLLLRGVNLGGWFVTELWMTPWIDQDANNVGTKIIDDFTLYDLLEKRFGKDKTQEIRDKWRANWITEQDFANIEKADLNCVRIPFRDELIHEPNGMEWLKKAVAMAKRHHIYVVLDMHGIPGGQSTDQPTGHANQNHFWTSPKDQQKYLDDWKRLAKTFGKDNTVAMFDLMNEPMGAPDTATMFMWQMRALRVIRALDKDTIIAFEDGYKGWNGAPAKDDPDRVNVCFQPHDYMFDAKSAQDHLNQIPINLHRWNDLRNKFKVPIYVGEWNVEPFGGPSVIGPMRDAFRDNNVSWTFWTWKVDPVKGDLGDWGIARHGKVHEAIDPFNDTYSQIMSKLELVNSVHFEVPPKLINSLRPTPV